MCDLTFNFEIKIWLGPRTELSLLCPDLVDLSGSQQEDRSQRVLLECMVSVQETGGPRSPRQQSTTRISAASCPLGSSPSCPSKLGWASWASPGEAPPTPAVGRNPLSCLGSHFILWRRRPWRGAVRLSRHRGSRIGVTWSGSTRRPQSSLGVSGMGGPLLPELQPLEAVTLRRQDTLHSFPARPCRVPPGVFLQVCWLTAETWGWPGLLGVGILQVPTKGLCLLIFKSISSDKWEPSHLWPPWVSGVPGSESQAGCSPSKLATARCEVLVPEVRWQWGAHSIPSADTPHLLLLWGLLVSPTHDVPTAAGLLSHSVLHTPQPGLPAASGRAGPGGSSRVNPQQSLQESK